MKRPQGARAMYAAYVACLAAACSPGLVKLPGGASVPASPAEAAAALAQVTTACASVRTFSGELAVSGSARYVLSVAGG